jgi:hypothetical protein
MQLRKLTPIAQAFVLSVLTGVSRKPCRDDGGGDEDIDEKSEYISKTDIVKDIIVEGYAKKFYLAQASRHMNTEN